MAAVTAPQATSALTPPTSSHGGQNVWNYAVPQAEPASHSAKNSHEYPQPSRRQPLNSYTNGTSRPDLSQKRSDTNDSSHSSKSNSITEPAFLAPARVNTLGRKDSSLSDSGSGPDSLLELYGTNKGGVNGMEVGEKRPNGTSFGDEEDPENSRWIHRDKLARIESEELQAAGIILPRTRASSKTNRRERSRDQQSNGFSKSEHSGKRKRGGSLATEEEAPENADWDLRLPGEAADDDGEFYRDMSGGARGVSRIPIAKTSPLPIPVDFLERDTPVRRKQSGSYTGDEEAISYPKSRGRSQSVKVLEDAAVTPIPAKKPTGETSPSKRTARKGSAQAPRAASASQRPKPKSGSARDNTGQRPTTRSGELNSTTKGPEGDPPWLASMYKPDPRLPPDQQLLPTVAKRLQQEQWEKEGKFGNAYDTQFRPLSQMEFPDQLPDQPSDIIPQTQSAEVIDLKPEQPQSEWPLRGPKSPALSTGRPGTSSNGSYSTMPKIQTHGNGKPQGMPTLPSPKTSQQAPIRLPEPPEETKKKGCGCCVVM
ncbi:hypothetical protein BP5796_04908 [Coleophoma crateriformis]|uniref:TeaA receptor TeaR n=1 Tax=Coleophoma crateriformis TaxID=565419 RepID=A0A3D8SAL5_9HELO|nr:hypothetical protein BP5796_04908 [Coleophoma crateriformis]